MAKDGGAYAERGIERKGGGFMDAFVVYENSHFDTVEQAKKYIKGRLQKWHL